MVTAKARHRSSKIKKYLKKACKADPKQILEKYGPIGLEALEEATPKDTGLTARSWSYEVTEEGNYYALTYYNSHVENGVNIAIILDIGHGKRDGGFVQGRYYIKPALRPIFDKIYAEVWKEVTDAK